LRHTVAVNCVKRGVDAAVFQHQQQIPPAIGVLEEDVLAPVAALSDACPP